MCEGLCPRQDEIRGVLDENKEHGKSQNSHSEDQTKASKLFKSIRSPAFCNLRLVLGNSRQSHGAETAAPEAPRRTMKTGCFIERATAARSADVGLMLLPKLRVQLPETERRRIRSSTLCSLSRDPHCPYRPLRDSCHRHLDSLFLAVAEELSRRDGEATRSTEASVRDCLPAGRRSALGRTKECLAFRRCVRQSCRMRVCLCLVELNGLIEGDNSGNNCIHHLDLATTSLTTDYYNECIASISFCRRSKEVGPSALT